MARPQQKGLDISKANVGDRVAREKEKTADRVTESKAENNPQVDSGTQSCDVEKPALFVLIWKH